MRFRGTAAAGAQGAARAARSEKKVQGMKLITIIDGAEHELEIVDANNGTRMRDFLFDSEKFAADVEQVEPGVYSILVGEKSYEVQVEEEPQGFAVFVNGTRHAVAVRDPRRLPAGAGPLGSEGPQKLSSSMPGRVVKVLAAAGDPVEAGQGLVVVEAMKMQNEIKSPKAGKIAALEVAEGDSVGAGETLVVVE